MAPCRACRACLLPHSVGRPIIGWPGKSLMSNWSKRRSRLRKRPWPDSSLRPTLLAFDTANFDTHIATVTPGELARRGHAKSKRGDLRVVGLGVLVSETGHVPLLYRTYSGNSSDQAVLPGCLARVS